MAKEKVEKAPEVKEVPKVKKTERELVWDEYLADYAQRNPVKYAAKRATTYTEIVNNKEVVKTKKDELAVPPDTFQGKIDIQLTPQGKQVKIYY